MEKKGLCQTCVNDKACTFPRRFPVLQCEEFEEHEPVVAEGRKNATRCKSN
jgi:hypothetical protein